MGPLSSAIAVGCLTALRWLFWFTGALCALLIIKQVLAGDGMLPGLAVAVLAFAVLGWLSGFAAHYIQKAQDS